MSDAYGTDSALVEGRSSAFERASALAVGLGFLAFVFSWATLFRITPPTAELLGVPSMISSDSAWSSWE